ncbi:MAG: hypothetical protein V2J20_13070 [Wenzhouxiangella sp.]|jgi:hypothetical protein|nr:hypothetical protein [Wenzhouxiangella sp.]
MTNPALNDAMGSDAVTGKALSPRALRDEMVGRTISGVIARPGGVGEPPVVLMMRFDDGSVIEFVSPRSDRLLKRSLRRSRDGSESAESTWSSPQLSFDGLLAASGAC